MAAKIKGQVVTAKVKGGASGKLYGKVTGKEVAELLTTLTYEKVEQKKLKKLKKLIQKSNSFFGLANEIIGP